MISAKIMLLGEIGVGKSSIARRLVHRQFDGVYKPTIGVDVYRYEVKPQPGPERFQFIVWDTDGNFGNTIFRSVYVNEAHAALVVADVNRRMTIETAARLAEGFADALPGRYVGCVINKCDEPDKTVEGGLPPVLANGEFPIFRSSAKTGFNVENVFHEAAIAILRRRS